MIQTLLAMIGLYLIMFVLMLTAGGGSLFYFSSKINPSPQSIDEFNKRLPGVLRKIYGYDGDYGNGSAKRVLFSGVFYMLFGGGFSIFFVIAQIVEIFRYGTASQDVIIAIFVVVEVLTLVYFLNLGPMLVKIEHSRQEDTLDGNS